MKKSVILFCFFASMQTALAQADSIDIIQQKIVAEKNADKKIGLLLSVVSNASSQS
jgi:hypothetical protein